jgi:hypothetical protein
MNVQRDHRVSDPPLKTRSYAAGHGASSSINALLLGDAASVGACRRAAECGELSNRAPLSPIAGQLELAVPPGGVVASADQEAERPALERLDAPTILAERVTTDQP